MWKGFEPALIRYAEAICKEWIQRGYKDSLLPYFETHPLRGIDFVNPQWTNDEKLHASHRSNLLRKDKEFYSRFGWTELDNLPYIWYA